MYNFHDNSHRRIIVLHLDTKNIFDEMLVRSVNCDAEQELCAGVFMKLINQYFKIKCCILYSENKNKI